jgi:hypothetical protein
MLSALERLVTGRVAVVQPGKRASAGHTVSYERVASSPDEPAATVEDANSDEGQILAVRVQQGPIGHQLEA